MTPQSERRSEFTIPEFGGDAVLEFSNLAYYARSKATPDPVLKAEACDTQLCAAMGPREVCSY